MNNLKLLFVLFLLVVFIAACVTHSGSGVMVKRTQIVENFDKVDVSSGIKLILRYGTTDKLQIEADDNIIDDVEIHVSNGTLHVGMEGNSYSDTHVTVIAYTASLRGIEASSAAHVEVEELIKQEDKLKIYASSASHIDAIIDAGDVTVEASSSANVTLTGKCRTLSIESSSASEVNAYELLSESAMVDASSASHIKLFASVSLKAYAASAAKINYKGSPKVEVEESSAGTVGKVD